MLGSGDCDLHAREPQFSSVQFSLSYEGSRTLLVLPCYHLFASLSFIVLHQSLDVVAWCAVQSNGLAARRAHHLGAHGTLGGDTHFKHLVDGLPETVEVVVYQPCRGETTQQVNPFAGTLRVFKN